MGLLFDASGEREFLCYTLEDVPREVKVSGATRIPAGHYRVTLRTEGGFNARYAARFSAVEHRGMLWLRDVPGFEYVLIHIGNTEDDTAGCILLGDAQKAGAVLSSSRAYWRTYPRIAERLEEGGEVWINIEDWC